MSTAERLALMDWKRRIADLYREAREAADPKHGWRTWRDGRAELFRSHPASPIPLQDRAAYGGILMFSV